MTRLGVDIFNIVYAPYTTAATWPYVMLGYYLMLEALPTFLVFGTIYMQHALRMSIVDMNEELDLFSNYHIESNGLHL